MRSQTNLLLRRSLQKSSDLTRVICLGLVLTAHPPVGAEKNLYDAFWMDLMASIRLMNYFFG